MNTRCIDFALDIQMRSILQIMKCNFAIAVIGGVCGSNSNRSEATERDEALWLCKVPRLAHDVREIAAWPIMKVSKGKPSAFYLRCVPLASCLFSPNLPCATTSARGLSFPSPPP